MVFGASGFQGFQEGVLQGSFMGLLRVACFSPIWTLGLKGFGPGALRCHEEGRV